MSKLSKWIDKAEDLVNKFKKNGDGGSKDTDTDSNLLTPEQCKAMGRKYMTWCYVIIGILSLTIILLLIFYRKR